MEDTCLFCYRFLNRVVRFRFTLMCGIFRIRRDYKARGIKLLSVAFSSGTERYGLLSLLLLLLHYMDNLSPFIQIYCCAYLLL